MNQQYKSHNNNDQRLWGPLLAGAAIISAPFWFGLSKNNNNNNCYSSQDGVLFNKRKKP